MFRGTYEHSVDAKGRLALPASFKKELAKFEGEPQLVITQNLLSPCLDAYPLEAWRRFEARLAEESPLAKHVMILRRRYVGRAMDCPVDKVGRILLPAVLRKRVDIDREVVWMGVGRNLELWSPAALDEDDGPLDEQTSAAMNEMMAHLRF